MQRRLLAFRLGTAALLLLEPSCVTAVLYDYTDGEVAVVGVRLGADDESVDGLRLDVKNVDQREDGSYVIELPESLLHRHMVAAAEPAGSPVPPQALEVCWVAEGPVIRMIQGWERWFSESLEDLHVGPASVDSFDLRTEVRHREDQSIVVDVWIDVQREGIWAELGSADIGAGTQRTGLRQTAWVLAPAAVAVDLVGGAVGICYWAMHLPLGMLDY